MKENTKLSKVAEEKKSRKKISAIYILIAVVAIIECAILISFTTYSWIETASSLVIETGKKHYDDSYSTRIPIAGALNYKFVPDTATDTPSDLNSYFSYAGQSSTQNLYRYSRASSPNGKDFYFINSGKNGSNTTITGATSYRKGDYIDINSNYTYFDFTVSNTGDQSGHKLKFYFADANVFTVTNGEGSSLTNTQLNSIRDAMRISFQTGKGTPKIYSLSSATYNAVNTTAGATKSVTTTAIEASENQKLFTIGKNSSQDISVRIWLEEKASGISGLTGAQLAGAVIKVNLQLAYAQNDYDYIYFDDYTLSSGIENKDNIGGHLTEDYPESDDYRMYFVYRTSDSNTGYVYPMTLDDSGSNTDARCWVTCDSSGSAASSVPDITGQTYITNLTTSGNPALSYSYFAYGKCATTRANTSVDLSNATTCNALYTWKLNASPASSDSELRYSAYSVTRINSTKTSTPNTCTGYGAGGWTYTTPLTRVYFRDLATGNTGGAYNTGENFQYITTYANIGSDTDGSTTTHRANVVYMNTNSAATYNETYARTTAALYYDKGADGGKGLFTSWVPSSWLTGESYFRYCPNGYYNNTTNNYCAIRWTAPAATHPKNNDNYIYTALGYGDYQALTTYTTSTALTNNGVGCWNAIESEPVYFSTELIDNSVTSDFRYQIGVKINGASSASYYNLIPDETNMKFYAYVPVPGTNANPTTDYADGAILFRSYASVAGTNNGTWFGHVRNGSRTYYPVALNTTTATSAAPKGYWNLSVIVDGTYEHFFWDTGDPSDTEDDGVLGSFGYNTTGHTGTNVQYDNITPNMIDEYRWYVPFDITSVGTMPDSVYFKWEPYTDTVFKYTHYRSEGIYCVITESPNAVQ